MKNFIVITIVLIAGIMISTLWFFTPRIIIMIVMIILESMALIYFYRKLKN